MRAWIIRWTVVSVVAVAALTAGCLKYKESTIVLPDGSGRILIWLSAPANSLRKATQDIGVTTQALARFLDESEGVAAITGATTVTVGGWDTTTLTVWFDDANSVWLRAGDQDVRLRWRADGDGFVFESSADGMRQFAGDLSGAMERIARAPPSDREFRREMLARSRKLWADVSLVSEVRMPGIVTSMDGFERVDDRTVSARISKAEFEDAAKLERLGSAASLRARCGPSQMTAAEIAKFRTEIAAAKAAWSRDPASSVVAGKLGRPLTAPVASIGTWCVNGPATRICWSAETADDDGPERATVIDATGAKIAEFDLGETAEDSPTDLFLSEDGKRLVAADWIGCSVAVYDVPTGKELWRKRQPDSGDLEADLDEEWLATPVAPASVALVKGGRSVEILDVETGAVRRRWTETEDVVHICAAGTSRLVLAQESSVTMIDTETGKRIWSTPSPSSSPDDGYDWVVAGSEGGPVLADRGMIGHGSVDALDPATGARLWTLAGIGSIDAVSRSGRLGAVFGRPPLIVDLSNGRVLGRVTLSEPAELFEKYEFGADERSLLVRRGAADGELIVPVALDLPAPLPATPGGK